LEASFGEFGVMLILVSSLLIYSHQYISQLGIDEKKGA